MFSDFEFILLFLVNILITLGFFIFAVIYFFIEAGNATRLTGKKTVLTSALICAAAVINALLTRYAVTFPKVDGFDMNSDFTFITNIISALIGFFIYICYIRTGQGLAPYGRLPGSLLIGERNGPIRINWKLILTPLPLLIIWTFAWFSIFPPEPTELAYATNPEGDNLMSYVYIFFTASILAPIQEEIMYRHFAMGLLAKWFGDSKLAVALNIGLSAFLFSIAHVGVVTEDWIKIVQIMPAGLVFGIVNKQEGLEHSILSHSLFNTAVIPITMLLEYIMGI
ncbi:MAG TPA: CPBP family intramembrane metalloprotease [Clostridiales bacterium]|nr:CPBP family intramembrane metalloprotease [Clostridiales bacterium]